MIPANIEQVRAALRPKIQVPEGASAHVADMIAVLNTKPMVYKERAVLKTIEEPIERLKSAPDQERLAFVFEAVTHMASHKEIFLAMALKAAVAEILRKGVPLSCVDAVRLVDAVNIRQYRFNFPYKALVAALKDVPMTPALSAALMQLRAMIGQDHGFDEVQERIDVLVHGKQEKPAAPVSGWSRQVFQEADASGKQMAWRRLFLHARTLTQSTPSSKWNQEALACVEQIGRADFLEAARRWLQLGPMPGMPATQQVPDEEADYQKGFVWTLGAVGDTSVAAAIADFALACFRKIPQIGAVSHRVGNACVNALAAMPGLEAVTQISRLAMRVKYDVAQRLIEKALVEAAERNNVGRDDLEAMAVPSYGLNDRVRIEALGSCEAKLSIESSEAVLTWWRDGKPLKSPPAEAKTDHADALADLKKVQKELQAVLSTQRLRLERQLLSDGWCRFDCWRDWYLNHPVTSTFARRLIWEIQDKGSDGTAIWHQGALVDWAGHTLTPNADALVRLWHPIRSELQEILSWRAWLEDRDVRQPFKQAHREVYILTDAERETGTYSNRFAGHIVRQHPLAALCRERGWQFKLMGEWDSHNNPQLEIPRYGLRVEFHVDFLEGSDVSGHMIYIAIATGQVRFFAIEAKPRPFEFGLRRRQPLPLTGIPPVVLSEVMRDLDLFTGVTSIGADPNWGAEHGGAHAEYWHRFADGELTTAAATRKTVLERLMPKLAIRDRCRFTDRHLVVRGESREYKIHLGSGNVLMEPGSRYLCIVRGAGDSAASVPLPFEGDSMLATILSKAILLANDKTIKDESIVRQIRAD